MARSLSFVPQYTWLNDQEKSYYEQKHVVKGLQKVKITVIYRQDIKISYEVIIQFGFLSFTPSFDSIHSPIIFQS